MSNPTNPAALEQDIDERIIRTISFAHDLNGSTITGTPVWVVPTGLSKISESNTTTTASVLLAATELGSFLVQCTATLVNGEIIQAHFQLTIRD